jgi:uncharacterized tellurite resistance protein B-like protein
MLGRLKDLFSNAEPRRHSQDELRLAAAALLAEAARLDGAIEPSEREAIERVLARRFDLAESEAAELTREGEAAAEESIQIFGFTRIINRDWPVAERAELFEMIYEVIYADHALNDYEANLMRRLGELVYLPDKERGEARQRVLRRLGRES